MPISFRSLLSPFVACVFAAAKLRVHLCRGFTESLYSLHEKKVKVFLSFQEISIFTIPLSLSLLSSLRRNFENGGVDRTKKSINLEARIIVIVRSRVSYSSSDTRQQRKRQ